jgi:hypothetical protein
MQQKKNFLWPCSSAVILFCARLDAARRPGSIPATVVHMFAGIDLTVPA